MEIFYFLIILTIFSILLTSILNKKKARYEGILIDNSSNIEIENKLFKIKVWLKIIFVVEAIISTIGLIIFMRT